MDENVPNEADASAPELEATAALQPAENKQLAALAPISVQPAVPHRVWA